MKYIVVNTTNPELGHLAAELAKLDKLEMYFCPYLNMGRWPERLCLRIPGISALYSRTLGRRDPPESLNPTNTTDVGVIEDFLIAVLRRSPFQKKRALTLANALQYRRELLIQRRAEALIRKKLFCTVVSNYSVALGPFSITKGRKVLNFPFVEESFYEKFLITERNLEPAFASMLPNSSSISTRLSAQKRSEVAAADLILVGSSFARSTFLKSGIASEKVVACPYGADLSLFCPPQDGRLQRKKVRLMFAGGISQRKGISYLLKAFEKIIHPGVELYIVGNVLNSDEPLSQYKDLFTHIPNVPRAKLAQLYQAADIFVFPSLCEGMGLVVAEAMASGLPVISTPVGPDDLIRDGVDGFIVPERDVPYLAERLKLLINDEKLRLELGRNAKNRASLFSWQRYKDQLVNLLDETK